METSDISVANLSLLDLTPLESAAVIKALATVIQEEQAELEELKQQHHNVMREITRQKSMQNEWDGEIEAISTSADNECKVLEDQLQENEDAIKNARNDYQQKIHELQQQITAVNEAVSESEASLQLLKTINCNLNDYDKTEQTLNENIDWELELETMTSKVQSYERKIEDVMAETDTISSEIEEYENEVEILKDSVSHSTSKLHDIKLEIESMQAEITQKKSEIDNIKNAPLDSAKRGNSLFAEVHDRRVQLENKLGQLQTAYMDKQAEYEGLLKEIKFLKAENMHLTGLWKKDLLTVTHVKEEEQLHIEEIQNLKQIVERQMNVLSTPFTCKTQLPEAGHNYIRNCYRSREEKNVKLLKDLIACMDKRLDLVHRLATVNGELYELRATEIQLKCRMSELKMDRDLIFSEKRIKAECDCRKQVPVKKKSNSLASLCRPLQPQNNLQYERKEIDLKTVLSLNDNNLSTGTKCNKENLD